MIHFLGSSVWIGIMVVSLIIEGVTMGITAIWVFLAALCALFLYNCHVAVNTQILVFLFISIASDYFFRPYVLKMINFHKSKKYRDELVGKTVKVLSITNDGDMEYRVLLDQMEWNAKSVEEENIFRSGDIATIVSVEENTVVIQPCSCGK